MNYKRKANYKSKRSCGLCKPWKRAGNSTHADHSPKYKLYKNTKLTSLLLQAML